jgi:F-type H+-transporting ATPase subunit epsilon
MSIKFELITPERTVFRTEVDQVTLPTAQGEITILPNHIPLVATLVPGVAHLKKGQAEEDVAVSGGFIQIQEGNRIRVLADTAERGAELDIAAIEQAKNRAEKVMQETVRADEASYMSATAALERELARYKTVMKHRKGKHTPTIESAVLPRDTNEV